MTGMIQGGWEYVWATYAITAAALLAYGTSLALRLRRAAASRVGAPSFRSAEVPSSAPSTRSPR